MDISSVNDKRPGIRGIVLAAVWLISPILIFAGLFTALGPSTKPDKISDGQVPPSTIFVYTENVPLRLKANEYSQIEDTLYLPSDPRTGQRRTFGCLSESEVGGVRVNPDQSVWIIVIKKDENIWVEFLAPSRYFKIAPGAGNVAFLKNIKLD